MSSPVAYLEFQPNSQPGFLQDENARNWGGALGYTKDLYVEISIAGVQARFANVCPADALSYHGSERGLPRYQGDTDDGYRARVEAAWDLWEMAGTEEGILENLAFAGFARDKTAIYEAADWADPDWWDFWLAIDATDGSWGSLWYVGTPGISVGDGHVIGFTSPPPNYRAIRAIVKKWKPAHTKCRAIYVILSGWLVGQRGITIGQSGLVVGGERVTI